MPTTTNSLAGHVRYSGCGYTKKHLSVSPTIVITETLHAVCAEWLKHCANVVWCEYNRTEDLANHLANADGLIVRTYTRVIPSFLDLAPRLRVIGRAGVGLDNIDLEACKERKVHVVYTPNANTEAVVEYTLAVILDALRPRITLNEYVSPSTFHELRQIHVGRELAGLHLGILGFGRIGRRLGAVAQALGMKLLVHDLISANELRSVVDYAFEYVDKPTLYRTSDILSIHIDGRHDNRHFIDARALQQLQPHCLLVNTSRGMVVDETALATWAQKVSPSGGGAIIDVHDPEPPPKQYPLFGLSNVRLLPHLASRTNTALEKMSWVVRDVMAVLEGQTPRYPA